MQKVRVILLLAASALLVVGCGRQAQQAAPRAAQVTLTIESWRNDDLPIWQDTILPAFHKRFPDIKVVFSPTAPTEYNAALNAKLEGGTAGD